jgi:hypothetical protein
MRCLRAKAVVGIDQNNLGSGNDQRLHDIRRQALGFHREVVAAILTHRDFDRRRQVK